MSAWLLDPSGETATSEPLPVIADGELFAVVSMIWSDVDGVRVHLGWCDGARIEDLGVEHASALAEALLAVKTIEPPARA